MASPAPEPTVLIEIAVRYDEETGIVHVSAPGIDGFRTTIREDPALQRGHPLLYRKLKDHLERSGAVKPWITARQMAATARIDYRSFRHALWRAAKRGELQWHGKDKEWRARIGSPEHRDMQLVMGRMLARKGEWAVRP